MKLLPFDVFSPSRPSLKRILYISSFNTHPANRKKEENTAISASSSIINLQ